MPDPVPSTRATQPACRREDALAVVKRLRDAGHVAYFAGGCVRDLLLGLEPKDYDVATDAPPDRVRALFNNTQAVGAAFGVILVRRGGSQVEVATFRADGTYEDGRRPTAVRFTTAEEDARRRDFTINGLFLDPLKPGGVDDQVIDHVGGRDDLAARRLRAIGDPDERLAEDHLRLVRAVRFAARFALEIDPATAGAIRRNAPSLKGISPERVAEELRKALTGTTRAEAWRLLWDLRLLPVIFRFLPEAVDADGVKFDDGRSVFRAFAPGEPVGFGAALAAGVVCFGFQVRGDARLYLAHKSARRAVAAMRDALRISNDEEAEMRETLAGADLALADNPLASAPLAAKKRFLARPGARRARDLLAAVDAATVLYAERIRPLEGELSALEETEFAPPPLINGDDLAAAGLTPGPVFKRVLEGVYDEQLEGRLKTKEQALDLALRLARPGADQVV